MGPLEVPFEEQILAFEARLAQRGLGGALELLNDRTTFRYTALYAVRHGNLHPRRVFDRFGENRAYLQSVLFLEAVGRITLADGDFVASDCRQDDRLRSFGGLIVSYCGLVLAPAGGPAVGVLCHFDMDRREVKPCELAFLRAVVPLLLDCLDDPSPPARPFSVARGGSTPATGPRATRSMPSLAAPDRRAAAPKDAR